MERDPRGESICQSCQLFDNQFLSIASFYARIWTEALSATTIFKVPISQTKLNLKSSDFFLQILNIKDADGQKGAPSNINIYRLDIYLVLEVEHQ